MSFRSVSKRARFHLDRDYDKPGLLWNLSRRATLLSTGLAIKLLLSTYNANINNLDLLLEAYHTSKIEGRGLLTVMNHVSVVDEPLVWGFLPTSMYMYKDGLRWTLGADNICFKNKFLSKYFSLGQVLGTKRFGAGPFQTSVDCAVELLSPNCPYSVDALNSTGFDPKAKWVHIFPESYVHQPLPPHQNSLRYFHWGVSRMVLEATKPPIVVPIFGHGLEKAWPEDRPKSSSFFKGMGTKIQFNVGQPLDERAIADFRKKWLKIIDEDPMANMNSDLTENLRTGPEATKLRSEVASFLRDGVLQSRECMGFYPEEESFGDPAFWRIPEKKSGVKVIMQDDVRKKLYSEVK